MNPKEDKEKESECHTYIQFELTSFRCMRYVLSLVKLCGPRTQGDLTALGPNSCKWVISESRFRLLQSGDPERLQECNGACLNPKDIKLKNG